MTLKCVNTLVRNSIILWHKSDVRDVHILFLLAVENQALLLNIVLERQLFEGFNIIAV